MKKIILFLSLFLSTTIFNQVFAQEKNFVISTEKPHQVGVIIETANTIAEEFENNLGEIQIVLYGPAVKKLEEEKTVETWLKNIKHEKIRFAVCDIAIEKTNTDKKYIPAEMQTVENAFVHILRLKAKGYIGLEP